MVNLDDTKLYEQIDKSSMSAQLRSLPQQCQNAWEKALAFELPSNFKDIDKVVILGMGGSAIGGDLVRSLTLHNPKPLIFVNRDYGLPSFVDEKTLVIASSYSGKTEETLSAFSQALKVPCKKLAVTTGGTLQEMAAAVGIPVFTINHVSPPRAALGYGFMPLLAFLRNLGFLEGISLDVEAMINYLKLMLTELKESVPTDQNRAKQIAQRLLGKIAVIYGADITTEVARRWKTQINENAKAWAFYETLPELNHNSVVGYEFPEDLKLRLYVLFLRSPGIHPHALVRFQVTGEILAQSGIGHYTVGAQGKDELGQMMGLIYLGDWVSYYLAILNKIDPTPVTVIDYLKKKLSEA